MQTYDYAVIGAGPGGYVSAIRAAQLGLKTVLIEKDATLGGTCLNVGCIPSKAILESSEQFEAVKHKLADHGVITGGVKLDLNRMMSRKDSIVKTLTDGVAMLMKKNKVTVMQGTGRLSDKNRIKVESSDNVQEIEAETIVLAMGSVPVELPFMRFDGKTIVSSTEALSFDKVPDHLIVVGAGAVGLELGSVWSRLGSKVTVIEMLPQITPFADRQMAIMLQRSLTNQGLNIHLETKVTGATVKKGKVVVTYEDKEGKPGSLKGDKVLVSVGRKPNSKGCGLEDVGVTVEKNGMIPVDSQLQTNVAGIYAIGDLIHGPMLAHKAEEDGIAIAEIAAGKAGHVNYDIIPSVVYTEPEMAAVGLSEEQAKDRGIKYKVGKFFYRGNGRALSLGATDGLVKILADAESDRLLGVHILGTRASDLIAEAVAVMEFSGSSEDIARTVHAHPSLSEIVKEAAMAVEKRAIHS